MLRSSLVLFGVVFGVVPALAQVPDHLKCYKMKDSLAKAEYTADLGGLAAEPGCLIRTPAKMLCVETAKTNVTPAPPGAAPGSAAGMFACYKVKCAKGPKLPVTVDDQFGSRAAEVIGPKLLCAPANVGPTTTTTSSTTTASSSSTTSTIVEIACNWPGEARWLSHGFDGGNAFTTGAWLSCTAGVLSDVQFVNGGATAVNPPPSGTSDTRIGCNWVGVRWASQGYDGATAFTAGATVSCDGDDVTGLAWESNVLGATGAAAGNLACNWSGAIYLSHGLDGGCAFQTGFNVTCNANQITHFEWVEGCPKAR